MAAPNTWVMAGRSSCPSDRAALLNSAVIARVLPVAESASDAARPSATPSFSMMRFARAMDLAASSASDALPLKPRRRSSASTAAWLITTPKALSGSVSPVRPDTIFCRASASETLNIAPASTPRAASASTIFVAVSAATPVPVRTSWSFVICSRSATASRPEASARASEKLRAPRAPVANAISNDASISSASAASFSE